MKNSIPAGALARQLATDLAANRVRAHAGPTGKHNLRLTARICVRGGKPSGGAHIIARIDPPSYGASLHEWAAEKRIRAGWSEQTIYRHAAALAEGLRQRRANPLVQRREALEKLADSKEFDADNLPREPKTYDQMNDEEMNFWFDWLRQHPDKAQP